MADDVEQHQRSDENAQAGNDVSEQLDADDLLHVGFCEIEAVEGRKRRANPRADRKHLPDQPAHIGKQRGDQQYASYDDVGESKG